MTKITKTALVCVGLAFASTSAFAQAGGADVPSDAKKAGTMENGSSSTGMSKSEAAGGSMKSNSGATGAGKTTATGGNAGGGAGKN